MKITVKQLQGRECWLEVEPTTTILEIKNKVEKKLNIAVRTQRLLHLGKTLADENAVSFYPAIKNGTKLNLAVKKPEGLYAVSLKVYKRMGMNDAEAAKSASRLLIVMKEKLDQMSMDEIERLTEDFLLVKEGRRPMHVEHNCTEDARGI